MPGGRKEQPKYPIKTVSEKVKWFGVCQCTSRGEEWTSKKIVELDTKDIKVAAAVTANVCYFKGPKGLKMALEEYEQAKKEGDAAEMFFWGAVNGFFGDECVFINKKKTGMAVVDEEWWGGFGRTKEEAQEMYFKSIKIMNRNMGDDDSGDDF